MKKIFLLILSFIFVFSMSACNGTESETKPGNSDVDIDTSTDIEVEEDNDVNSNDDVNNEIDVKQETENKSDINVDISTDDGQVLSPEAAVDIYMKNKDVWMKEPEYMPMYYGYGYCLLDLDFDGVLELISSMVDGTSRYSDNAYYRINTDTCTVEKITGFASADGFYKYDIYYLGPEHTKLLKNKTDNRMFYYSENYTLVSVGEYMKANGKFCMNDDALWFEGLFIEYYCADGLNGNEEVTGYNYLKSGEPIEASKAEYDEIVSGFFEENTDMNLTWKCISGKEFDESDDNKRRQLLIDAYSEFSYDGFSF